jgi:hypothetical protein
VVSCPCSLFSLSLSLSLSLSHPFHSIRRRIPAICSAPRISGPIIRQLNYEIRSQFCALSGKHALLLLLSSFFKAVTFLRFLWPRSEYLSDSDRYRFIPALDLDRTLSICILLLSLLLVDVVVRISFFGFGFRVSSQIFVFGLEFVFYLINMQIILFGLLEFSGEIFVR